MLFTNRSFKSHHVRTVAVHLVTGHSCYFIKNDGGKQQQAKSGGSRPAAVAMPAFYVSVPRSIMSCVAAEAD